MSKEYSKGISFNLYGPKFATNAVEVAFHSQDHALAAISQNSLSLNGGTVNKLKLQKTKVHIINVKQLAEKVTLLFFQRLIARIYSIQDLMSNY